MLRALEIDVCAFSFFAIERFGEKAIVHAYAGK